MWLPTWRWSDSDNRSRVGRQPRLEPHTLLHARGHEPGVRGTFGPIDGLDCVSKLKIKPKKQVAALPVIRDPEGRIRVLLITSRETRRFIIPKGWPIKGRKNHRAAATEAEQEAGVVGRVHRKPIGSYVYWKRRETTFEYCKVDVFVLEVREQLREWKEKGQRRQAWLLLDDAIELVDEPGLIPSLRELPDRLSGKRGRRKERKATPATLTV